MKKISMLFLFASILITACKKNDSTTSQPTNNDPQAGSKWTFTIYDYNENGDVTNTSTAILVATEKNLAGSKWLVLTEQSTNNDALAIQKRDDGWWQLPLPQFTPSLWFKYPANVNDTYPLTISDGTTDNAIVTKTNSSITLPAGTYTDCTKVESHDTNSLENEFWFTNSGPVVVKITEWNQKAAGPASNVFKARAWELTSYTR